MKFLKFFRVEKTKRAIILKFSPTHFETLEKALNHYIILHLNIQKIKSSTFALQPLEFVGPWTQLVWTSANWYIQINKSLVGLFNSIWTHSDPNRTKPLPRQCNHKAGNKSQGQVRFFWSDSWARTLSKRIIKVTLLSSKTARPSGSIFRLSLTRECYAAVRPEILMFSKSFLFNIWILS